MNNSILLLNVLGYKVTYGGKSLHVSYTSLSESFLVKEGNIEILKQSQIQEYNTRIINYSFLRRFT